MPQSYEYITNRAVRGMFFHSTEAGEIGWVSSVADRMQSDQEVERYAFLSSTPAMRPTVGLREAVKPVEQAFTITNEDHHATLEVRRRDLRRDKTGQIERLIGGLATRAMQYPARLLSDLIANGHQTEIWDGQSYFDTDHAEGSSGAQSNDLTKAVSGSAPDVTPTTAAMHDAVFDCLEAIHGFLDDQGEPVNEMAREFQVMVPRHPHGGVTYRALAGGFMLGGDSSAGWAPVDNTLARMDGYTIRPVVNPRLSANNVFYVFRTDGQLRPMILQEEIPLDLITLGPDSEYCAEHGRCKYTVEWTGAVSYGRWQNACRMELT